MSIARYRTMGMVLLLVALNSLIAPFSLAVDTAPGYSLVTSPVSLNLSAKPGTKVSADVRVKNAASQAQTLAVSANKFKADGDSGKAMILGNTENDSTIDWVSFSPQKFDAEPGAWTTIKVTFDLPASAAFGYYYAIRISPAAAPVPEGGKAVYSGSNAILVLLEAETPNARRSVQTDSFESLHGIYEYLPTTFSARLENTGNVHVAPTGSIFIMQNGKQVSALDFNANGGNILPGSKRIFSTSWSDGFPVSVPRLINGAPVRDKANNVIYDLKWDFSQLAKLRFGKFTAKLVAAYPDKAGNSVELDASVDFWVIPWKLILILLALLFFAGVGVYVTFTKAARRAKHRKE